MVLTMAARKRRTTTAAPRRRRSYAAAPRRRSRRRSPTQDIPKAGMTIGLVAANAEPIKTVANNLSINGVKYAAQQAIQPEQLKKDAIYAGVGYGVGFAIAKFAPKIIKKPVGELARVIKRVF